MLAMGVIERSEAPYASPLVLVKNQMEAIEYVWTSRNWIKSLYLTLNQWCLQMTYFRSCQGVSFIARLTFVKDIGLFLWRKLQKMYVQLLSLPEDLWHSRSCRLVWWTLDWRNYNRMVRKLLDGSKDLESYVDDVLGHTSDWQKHTEMLRDFFERVRKAISYHIVTMSAHCNDLIGNLHMTMWHAASRVTQQIFAVLVDV